MADNALFVYLQEFCEAHLGSVYYLACMEFGMRM